jgi:hypothetical protein
MNLTSLSGGLMLAALAGVWLLILVPSWMKSSTNRERQREANRKARTIRNTVRIPASVERPSVAKPTEPKASELLVQDPRAWNAPGVPSQILRSPVGTLETPEIADVVDFAASVERLEAEKSDVVFETASINLDEILRRRRANG